MNRLSEICGRREELSDQVGSEKARVTGRASPAVAGRGARLAVLAVRSYGTAKSGSPSRYGGRKFWDSGS